MDAKLLIRNGDLYYEPAVEGAVSLDLERRGAPGKLTFTAIDDSTLKVEEGNRVQLTIDGTEVFSGFLFSRQYDQDGQVKMTAYDQLRYLKNKDIYNYENLTATQVVEMIADDYMLQKGVLEDTRWVIGNRVEDNRSLFDIILSALDLTLQNTGRLFVLYDECGKLTLRDIENMKLDLLVDAQTASSYDYTASIDSDTYNQISLVYDNQDAGRREVTGVRDAGNIERWGVLQYFEKVQKDENAGAKAAALLQLYNRTARSLTVKGALGDVRVRGGSSVIVRLTLGDIAVSNYMVVEKVSHKFDTQFHTMDLTLRGGEINV